jgi:hypothetical protein
MIPTLSRYLWEIQRYRADLQSELDRKLFLRLATVLVGLLVIAAVLWLK